MTHETLRESEVPYSSCHQQPETAHRFGEVVEPRRWIVLAAVCSVWITSAIGFLTFNATSGTSMRYFHITDENKVLFFTDVNMYCCLILGYLGCYLAYKYFRMSMIYTAVVTCIAGWVRYYAGDSYSIALLCQTLIGVAAMPLFGFATITPDRWFPTKERFTVNTITLFANYIGWGLGTMIPCIIMEDDETKMSENMLVQAYILTIPVILTVFFVTNKPKTPPSYSALVKTQDKGFWTEMKTLIKSKKFIGSSLSFGMVLGLSNSIPTTNSIFMDPLNLTYMQQGYITLGYIIAGLFTGFAATVYINKKGVHNCDFILKILFSISLVSLLALGFVFVYVPNPNMYLILACNAVLGIGFIGFMPFGCASIIETHFPIQEAISTNGMIMMATIFSIGASHLSIAGFVGKGGFLVLAALMFPCWVYMTFFYETDYKKQEADDQHQDIAKEIGAGSKLTIGELQTDSVME